MRSKLCGVVLAVGFLMGMAPASAAEARPAATGPSPEAEPESSWKPDSERSWWDRLSTWLSGGGGPESREIDGDGLPRHTPAPKAEKAPSAKRVKELTGKRTANGRAWLLGDGRVQREVSAGPLHYRDGKSGEWRPIDTSVTQSKRKGFAYGNASNAFGSLFGRSEGELVRVETEHGDLSLGVPDATALKPEVKGDTVTYRDAMDGADLVYEVTPDALKEKIVLDGPPKADPVFRFTLDAGGLMPRRRRDGAIEFRTGDGDGRPVAILPRPFMYDQAESSAPTAPFGKRWSDDVTQSLSRDGRTLTIRAGREWLAAKDRRWPVVIDPTIKIAPPPTRAQDVMISSESPDANFDGSWRLSAGTARSGVARSLLRFPLPEIPPGTAIQSAQLRLYWDQNHTGNADTMMLEARRATAAWDAATATWRNASGIVGERGHNTVVVDDGDVWQTAPDGAWPYATGGDRQHAVNGDYAYNRNATTGESYTWMPLVSEPGTYRVDAHVVTGPDRATSVPYTVTHAGGSKNYTIDQSAANAGGSWRTLGRHRFEAGTSGRVKVGDVADASKTVVADAVRLVKDAAAVRWAGDEGSRWHSFSVRSIVQDWLNGTRDNHGFVVKAVDESVLGRGGPRYEASEYAYAGETATYPKLVITYGRPGVELDVPTTIHATGAELSWPAYSDPCGFCPGDDIVEYQVHRSVHQTFTPSAATLVAPVATTVRSFTDTAARPTPADSPEPFGNAYYYMVAVKTRDGGVIPGPTRLVRLPKAGRVTRIYQSGVTDTTLSSARPDANHDQLDGQAWLSVGNNSATYGRTRTLIKFPDLTAIPSDARILDAEVKLWTAGVVGAKDAVWQLHGLTRDFNETQATWNRATSTTAWTSPGGDHGSLIGSNTNFTNDPRRRNFPVTPLVRWWHAAPSTDKGVLLRLANESSPASRAVFLSSEAAEPELRPQLVVTYLETTPEATYYAPDSPEVAAADGTQSIPVTLTNTTDEAWNNGDWVLAYRWARADGSPVSVERLETELPRDMPPGDTATVAARVKTPPASTEGNKRVDHVLSWDLYNKPNGRWLSDNAVGALKQSMAVEDSTSDQVGLEKFYAYAGKNTGSGSTVMNNLHAGNAVWSYDAFMNPSRGLATFVRLAYNSKDTSDSVAGYGWSLQTSTVMRLGTPLDPHPNKQGREVSLTDGDGTTHLWRLDETTGQYVNPAGVHLYLQKLVECRPNNAKDDEPRAWVLTRPDRTRFFFDCAGYMSSIEDNNGNRMDFTYDVRKSNNQPTKFLRYITDPTGQETLKVDYWAKGDAYEYVDDTTWTRKSASNLSNPHIIDHVRSITDVSGRRLEFFYTDKGLLGELVDGAGSGTAKTFRFRYDMTQGNKNVKLVRVTDPRGNPTELDYYQPPTDDPKFHWSLKTITDRLGHDTAFAYADPDGPQGQRIDTTVTDAEGNTTAYNMDGRGRPDQTTNAKSQTTKLGWDADNNVTRLEENNGAVSTWTYDPKTGYPTEIKGAEANKNGWPGTELTYQSLLNGHVADLIGKRSPERRLWTFGYTDEGDLETVTDPIGNSTSDPDDYTTRYTYDTWGQLRTATDANGNTSRTDDFDPNGYPRKVIDAKEETTTFAYDVRGQVTSVTDALGKATTQGYDLFGRPLESKVPKDQDAGDFIVTPAPEYDANDNVTKATAPNGAESAAVYDKADQMTASLAPRDTATGPARKTTYTYDKVGNLTSQTEPKGNLTAEAGDYTTTYTYDEIYQLTDLINAEGDRLSYVYDDAGNVSQVIDPRKNLTPDDDFTTTFWYDLDHRVRAVIDAARKAEVTTYDHDGVVVAKTDKGGAETLISNDARGKPVQVRVPHKKDGETVTYRTTEYRYDQVGNRTKVITPRGVATAIADDFTHETVYDELNRVKETRTPYDPNGDERYREPDVTTYAYDAVGRLATVSMPPSEGESVRNDTEYTYFDNGWTKTSTDPWDIVTSYDYNEIGRQTTRTLASAGGSSDRTMTWSYFPDGKLRTRADDGVPAGRHVVLVDNSDFNNVKKSGAWPAATSGGGFHGHNYQTHAAGSGSDVFEWTLNIPADGDYDVYVRYPSVSGAATSASFKITHGSGTATRSVDQTKNTGTWVNVGQYAFDEGNDSKITLSQNVGGKAVADAVKLVRDTSGETDNEHKHFTYGYDPNGNLTAITDASPGRRVDRYDVTYTQLNQVERVSEIKDGASVNTTSFTYDPNGALLTTAHDKQHARYEYDLRNLVSKVVNGESASDPGPKVTTFTYTDKGERLRQVKGNGNTVDHTYYLDGLLKSQEEKKPDGTLVSSHALTYDLNGNRATDVASKMNADDHAAYLNTTSTYSYDPRDRVAKVEKTGHGAGTETYTHDANNNVYTQTVDGVTRSFHYDRNRLLTSVDWTNGATANYNYDPFGRLDTVTAGGTVLERKVYDGFDHVTEHRTLEESGTTTTKYSYDPLDRTATKTTNAGTAEEETTTFNYLGLTDEVLDEEVAGEITKSYQYSPWGERLSQVTAGQDGAEDEDAFYGYNPHTDVEQLTDETGDTRATYGYTAYGKNDEDLFTGIDKPDAADPTKEPYNVYRYNAKRWDQGSGNYDMGFRDYSPGLNRFLTRDMYNGALADMNLITNPFTGNRYAFGGGNPITNIELDGHATCDNIDCVRASQGSDVGEEGGTNFFDWLMYWFEKNAEHEAVQNALVDLNPSRRDTEISVRGGGLHGGTGYVDVVQFYRSENRIDIWEVKPYTPYGRRTGEAQLRRYLMAAAEDWEADAEPGGYQRPQLVHVEETGEWLIAFNRIILYGATETEDQRITESVRYYVHVDDVREDSDLREELELQHVEVDDLLNTLDEFLEEHPDYGEQEDDTPWWCGLCILS